MSDSDEEEGPNIWSKEVRPEERSSTSFDKAVAKFEQFFQVGEITGPELKSKYVIPINSGLRTKPSEKKCREVMEQYPRPANLGNLQVPRTNEEVFELMGKGPIVVDTLIQKQQLLVSKTIGILAQVLESYDSDSRVMVREHFESLEDGLKFLISAFAGLCQTRKDIVRNNLGQPLSKLCNWETDVGATKLFDVEIGKRLKEKEEAKYKIKKPKKYGYVQ